MRPLILLLASLGVIANATARDIDGQYAVFGIGAEDCATYLVATEQGDSAGEWYRHWLLGYFSAVNNAAANTYNILGDKGLMDILSWLEGYCAANPTTSFSTAVAEMVSLLYADRQNMAPGKKGGWQKFSEPASAPP